MRKILLPISLLVVLVFSPSAAQDKEEPLFDQLVNTFQTKYFKIGALLQNVADFQIERTFLGNNGFNIANFRLNFSGELDQGFGYFLQTSFTQSPAILDARMYYRFSSRVTLDIGQFKAPFSKEFLTSAAGIDFVNRSQAVSVLRPGWQIGLQVRGSTDDNLLRYAAGIFNGNGFSLNNNDDANFMYVARIAVFPALGPSTSSAGALEIGANAAYSKDTGVSLPWMIFEGKRLLLGGDVRLTQGDLLVSGEVVYERFVPVVGSIAKPFGYHATVGYMVTPKSQVLLRWDSFRPDGLVANSDLVIAGLNVWPTKATEVQVNYVISTEFSSLQHHQLLVNAQLGF